MKLWQKDGSTVNEQIEKFTVGRDKEFDLLLAAHDVTGSLAHIEMLAEVGLLGREEHLLIRQELNSILASIRESKFSIDNGAEDIHSQIEAMLTERLGGLERKSTAEEAAMTR